MELKTELVKYLWNMGQIVIMMTTELLNVTWKNIILKKHNKNSNIQPVIESKMWKPKTYFIDYDF